VKTRRERQFSELDFLVGNLANCLEQDPQIGAPIARLDLSEYTVKNQVHRILHKVGAEDRSALIERYHSQVEIAPAVSSSAGVAI
jgi:hypothetical protein